MTNAYRRSTEVILLALVFAISSWATAQTPQSSPAPASSSSNGTAPDQKPPQQEDQKQDSGQNSQDAPAQPAKNAPAPIQQQTPPGSQGKVEGTSNDRLFYTLPNFLTMNGGRLPPMPVKDKFKAVALGNFDVVEFPWWGVLAAISQADNGDPAYGQGWLSYAKRYGTTMADSSIENFMVGAVFSSMLRQDPRFYQSGKGSFFRRTGYAVSRLVVTYSDSGHRQFNYSEIFGAATAGAISTYSYHPRGHLFTTTTPGVYHYVTSERTLSNAATTWGTQLALDGLTLEIKEFWPDIHRAIKKHKHNAPASSQP